MPDYIYYNADIINNTTADLVNGTTFFDPPVRFNETRDTALVKDASQYHFSIIRFTMDGANKDLPLFIPDIQEGTGQTNVNLTSYALALSYDQTWNISGGRTMAFSIRPDPRFVIYTPETQNPSVAPLPSETSAPQFQILYNGATTYFPNDVVTTNALVTPYNTRRPPFFRLRKPNGPWSSTSGYNVDDYVDFQGTPYRCLLAVPPSSTPNPIPPSAPANWVVGITGYPPAANPQYWTPIDGAQGSPQDLSSRYYWVYTYEHWLKLVNDAISDPTRLTAAVGGTAAAAINIPVANPTCAIEETANAFHAAWLAAGLTPFGAGANPFPFQTMDDFVAFVVPPKIVYDPSTNRFTIKADSDGYGGRITTFTPQPYVGGPPSVVGQATAPNFRLFFNTNMYGLFTNFQNIYWNTQDPTIGPFANTPVWLSSAGPSSGLVATPVGYTNEIIFPNKWYQNIEDYRLPPFAGVAPLGIVPTLLQKVYWLNEQDYESNSSLWSPISSILFTSTLLPIRSEQTGPPIILGQGNDAESSGTAQSAFQPIITDVALPMTGGAADYRSFIYYAPTAEYRLSDTTPSKQDIRNIDVQVFWKNRLDNSLNPITLFNLSSVSIKMMFRHKDAAAKAENTQVQLGGRRY